MREWAYSAYQKLFIFFNHIYLGCINNHWLKDSEDQVDLLDIFSDLLGSVSQILLTSCAVHLSAFILVIMSVEKIWFKVDKKLAW